MKDDYLLVVTWQRLGKQNEECKQNQNIEWQIALGAFSDRSKDDKRKGPESLRENVLSFSQEDRVSKIGLHCLGHLF